MSFEGNDNLFLHGSRLNRLRQRPPFDFDGLRLHPQQRSGHHALLGQQRRPRAPGRLLQWLSSSSPKTPPSPSRPAPLLIWAPEPGSPRTRLPRPPRHRRARRSRRTPAQASPPESSNTAPKEKRPSLSPGMASFTFRASALSLRIPIPHHMQPHKVRRAGQRPRPRHNPHNLPLLHIPGRSRISSAIPTSLSVSWNRSHKIGYVPHSIIVRLITALIRAQRVDRRLRPILRQQPNRDFRSP